MIWIDSIYQLQYYNQPKDLPCYCEALVNPGDMVLQGIVGTAPGNVYNMAIFVYSANGNTLYEDATAYFEYYFAQMPDGRRYFNARLKSYSPAMCAHACYILNVQVTKSTGGLLFNKWTERWCIANCCDVVRGISFTQDSYLSMAQGLVLTNGPVTPDTLGGGGPIQTGNDGGPPANECGERYITIASYFDCYDKFTGDFYGDPKEVYSGTASFRLVKITNIKGSIRKLPRNIQREYSLNCRLQQVQSAKQYEVEGYEFFPAWKMEEIESQFHASHIVIENYNGISKYAEYSGGTPFEAIKLTSSCNSYYKLNTVMNDCEVTQIFGCKDKCSTEGAAPMGFVVPATMQTQGYYTENRQYIGDTPEALIQYYLSQPGVTGIEELDADDYDCDFTTAFIVHGTTVPASFYVNAALPANRIFGQSEESLATLCQQVTPACMPASIGAIILNESNCTATTIGSISLTDMPQEELYITGWGDWDVYDANTEALRSQATVRIDIEVENENYTYDDEDPEATIPFINGEIIGYISQSVWPATAVIFTTANNASLPVDATLVIQTDGKLFYSGPVTAADLDKSIISLNQLTYIL